MHCIQISRVSSEYHSLSFPLMQETGDMFLLLQHLILLPRGLLRERGGPLLKVGHLGAVLGRFVALEALGAELAVPVSTHALLVAGHLGALALAGAPHQLGEAVRPGAMAGMRAILVVEEVVAEEGVAAARRLRRDEVGLALAAGVWK